VPTNGQPHRQPPPLLIHRIRKLVYKFGSDDAYAGPSDRYKVHLSSYDTEKDDNCNEYKKSDDRPIIRGQNYRTLADYLRKHKIRHFSTREELLLTLRALLPTCFGKWERDSDVTFESKFRNFSLASVRISFYSYNEFMPMGEEEAMSDGYYDDNSDEEDGASAARPATAVPCYLLKIKLKNTEMHRDRKPQSITFKTVLTEAYLFRFQTWDICAQVTNK
jgi:hypothetical protein